MIIRTVPFLLAIFKKSCRVNFPGYLRRLTTRIIAAITSSVWSKFPPTLKLNPRTQRINKTIIIVQSIFLINLYNPPLIYCRLISNTITATLQNLPCLPPKVESISNQTSGLSQI
jgi:hypothetical protein